MSDDSTLSLTPSGNLLANASFEQPHLAAGQGPTPVTGLPGWHVTRGSVGLVGVATWQPAPGEGDQSLELVGSTGPGTLEQSVMTEPGREYVFSGWMAHDPKNPVEPEGEGNVLLNGQFFLQLFHRDAQAAPRDMRWQRFAYRFRAAGPITKLAIAAVTNPWDPSGLASSGLVLDGLSVAPLTTNLLVNGDFETPPIPAGQPHLILDPTALPGWRVAPGGVVLVAPYRWQPTPGGGGQMLHLLNPLVNPPGTLGIIEQSFPTELGRLYTLTGWLSHNPVRSEGRVLITLNGELQGQLAHTAALFGTNSVTDMRWQPFLFTFRAAGEVTSLQIADVTGAGTVEGAVLDGLAVTAAEDGVASQVPAAPASLTAVYRAPSQIEIAWVESSPDATDFEIERREGNGDWARLALVAASTRRFIDFGVRSNTGYTYRVRALNEVGPSAWSNEVDATTVVGQ